MKSLRYLKVVVFSTLAVFLPVSDIARASGPVFVSGVQVKGVGSNVSSQEVVKVTNSSEQDIDVTGWCVVYASYTASTIPSGGSCIGAENAGDKLFLQKNQSMIMATNDLIQAVRLNIPDFTVDGILAPGLGNTTGSIYLMSETREVLDSVRWYTSSTSISGEVNLKSATGAPENISFYKSGAGDVYVSSPLPLPLSYGNLYEVPDVCRNIDGFQDVVPSGYELTDMGCVAIDLCDNIEDIQKEIPLGYVQSGNSCVRDMCENIDELQLTVPDGLVEHEGECYMDICRNIDGLQTSLPAAHYLDELGCYPLENRYLRVNELLPNISGSDTGLEFIELYNPFDAMIPLRGYSIEIGKAFEKRIELPLDATIAPGGYFVALSSALPFTLLNTTSSVRLITPAGEIADSTTYSDPAEDMSWSYIDDGWTYTNRETPGEVNLPSVVIGGEDGDGQVSGLASCGPGKYRYPLTNRCRSIVSDLSTISSCDADEYRNPETNRCRKIDVANATLAACAENQERNPVTNRCRAVQAVTSLSPCSEGQERNPETNRCRKILGTNNDAMLVASTDATDGSDDVYALSPSMIGAGAVLLAAGYGIFEWRVEMLGALRKLLPFLK